VVMIAPIEAPDEERIAEEAATWALDEALS
jgi:hypothetical protein